jgi:hypothetical protein
MHRATWSRVRDVVEHEPPALGVPQDAALAADALGYEDAADARRPHHAGRVELHELHVDQLGPGVVGEGMTVARVLPAVRGDAEGAADAAGREHDGLGLEEHEAAPLPVVAERAGDARAVLQQAHDRRLHVHVDAAVDAVILQRADHLQPGPVADVGEPRILVAAEVALQDPAVVGAVHHRAPRLQLAHAVRRLLRVQLGHPPVVEVLPAPHRVGEVHLPVVAGVDVGERRGDPALGHDGVGLAEQRLADQADRDAGGRGLDRGSQPGAARTDHQHVVLVRRVAVHARGSSSPSRYPSSRAGRTRR